jgi:hypothetical protein
MDTQIRFVVVSHRDNAGKRFAEMLRAHDQVKMYGDLFNRADYEVMAELESEGNLIKLGVDSIEYLESKVFLDVPKDAKAVGFTMNYEHAQEGPWMKLWSYVRKNLKVIHLKRKNRMATFLEPRRKSHEEIIVNPYEFQRFSELLGTKEAEFDTIFRHGSLLEVFWEHLKDFEAKGVQELEKFIPGVFCGPSEQAVENYQELLKTFSGPEINGYFK